MDDPSTTATLEPAELVKHTAWMRRLARALVGDEASAEDLVQTTLVAALAHPPAVDRDVRPWFGRVLRNFARMQFRHQQVRGVAPPAEQAVLEQVPADDLPGAEEALIRHEAARIVAGLVSALREPLRSTLLLHYAEGVPWKDIAERQRLPEGTVRRRAKEALDELRAQLDEQYRDRRRDWRAALAPLAGIRLPGRAAEAAATTLTGGAMMTTNTKLGLGLTAAALALAGVVGLSAAARDKSSSGSANATAIAPASPAAAPAAPTRAPGSARVSGPGSRPPPAAPVPSFTGTAADPRAALATLDGCRRELERLRRAWDAAPSLLITSSSGARFEAMPPSPTNNRLITPEIDRILAAFTPRPDHVVDCRVGRCRVTLLVAAGVVPRAPMKAIVEDPELRRQLRSDGREIVAALDMRRSKDAVTGAEVVQFEMYFNVPTSRTGKHRFDPGAVAAAAPATLDACRDQAGVLQKELDARRREGERLEEMERSFRREKAAEAGKPVPARP